MRLDAMVSFLKLVEMRSYVAASEALFMSPTTLQSHIRSIEDELGTPLVRFSGRQLVLTPAGTYFLVFAERTIGDYDQFKERISDIGHLARTRLRITASMAPAVHLIPPVIHQFRTIRPDVSVTVESGRVGEVLSALVAGDAHLAIVQDLHTELTHGMFTSTLVLVDDLAVVIRRDLYREPPDSLLSQYPLVVQTPTSLTRRYVEQWARSEGIRLSIAVEHNSFDGILAMALEGDYIGVVGTYTLAKNPRAAELATIALPRFSCPRRIMAVYPEAANPVVMEFVRTFTDYFRPPAMAVAAPMLP
jgi:LysR family transcriptional regulator, cyn operon transcriptional activator